MSEHPYPIATSRFEILFSVFTCWWIIGLFLDGWAHLHLASIQETFFTPWHAIFYSGFIATTLLFCSAAFRNRHSGFSWFHSLPREYHLALFGVCVFFLGGISDFLWHTILGIEVNIESLLSPPHILLFFGGVLTLIAPFHSLWHRDGIALARKHPVHVIIATALVWSVLAFITQFAHPYLNAWMGMASYGRDHELAQALGVISIIVQTVIAMGVILPMVRRWQFPPGGLLLLFGINAFLVVPLNDQLQFFFPMLFAGLLIDTFYRTVRKNIMHGIKPFRRFAFFVPMLWWAPYIITVVLTEGTWWRVHLWSGSILIAGLTGYLLSYVVVSPGTQEGE